MSASNYLENAFANALRGGGNGTSFTAPSAVRDWSAPGRLDVFCQSSDGRVVHAWYVPGSPFESELI